MRYIRKVLPRGIYVALALLTFCAVFAATAGVREALASRTQALRQTLAAAPANIQTLSVSSTWNAVSAALGEAEASGTGPQSLGAAAPPNPNLTEAQFGEITDQLHADYDKGALRLAPVSGDWASMTTQPAQVQGTEPGTGSTVVKFEVSYRQPLSRYMRLVAGHFPAPAAVPPPPPTGPFTPGQGGHSTPPVRLPVFQVVVTQQMAARFGLRVGAKIPVTAPAGGVFGASGLTYQVSGIVAPIDPNAAFWTLDPAINVPALQNAGSYIPPPYWLGGLIAGPGEAGAFQQYFGLGGLPVQWDLPMALGSIQGQQGQALSDELTSLGAQPPTLSGDVAPVADTLTASSSLLTTLGSYFAIAQPVDTLLWLLYVGLTVAGLAVLLLAARMVAMRRSAEVTVVRARGAALWQVVLDTGRSTALTCVPAAVAAVVLAYAVVPGAGPVGAAGWWPPLAVLIIAVCAPALMVAWQHRLPRRQATGRRQRRGTVRLVVEVMLVAASIAGIVVFRQQSGTSGSGVNPFTSAAPVLVAIPVVIVMLRLYPLVLRGLLRASVRTSGAPGFLGLARAARTALNLSVPAFALVLTLTVAAFAAMVRDAVVSGDVAASWQASGADVTVATSPAFPNFTIPPSMERAMAAVPGVTHAAETWPTTWTTSDGTAVTAIAVDPAAYATLVAATEGYSPVPTGLLAVPAGRGAAQPVLASPAAAATLGKGAVSISTQGAVNPITVRVTGLISSTPAWPAGGAFIIIPMAALTSSATPPTTIPVTELLLTGSNIDRAALNTAVRDTLPPGGEVTYRADVLSALRGAPLQRAAFILLGLAIVVAAVLGLAVIFLELALGAQEREATLARLATMGLGERQRARVVALEVLPAVIAAGLAAWASALLLPRLVASAIDLSVFTNTPVQVPIAPGASVYVNVPLVPDVASVALPLAALVIFAALGLGVEIRSGRRRSAAYLRIGG
jgi:putative ABC transport system permease protein